MNAPLHAALPLKIRGVSIDPPVVNASGAIDPFSPDAAWRCEPEIARMFGVCVTKTTTIDAREGNPQPWVELHPHDDQSLINAVGLANPGIDAVLRRVAQLQPALGVPVLLSIAGDAAACVALVNQAERSPQIAGYEVNLSCPNVGGGLIGADPEASAGVVAAVRARTERPVIAKLSPASDIARIAVAVERAGADAICAVNTMPVRAVDDDGQPILGTINAGLSGRLLHPIALRCVAAVAAVVKIPVIGVGGVASAAAVRRMFHAGASAVGVGTGGVLDAQSLSEVITAAGCATSPNML